MSLQGNDGNKGECWCRAHISVLSFFHFICFAKQGLPTLAAGRRGTKRRGAGVCDAGHRGPSVMLAIRRGVLGKIGESRAKVTLSLGVSDKALEEFLWGALEEVSRRFAAHTGLSMLYQARRSGIIHPLTPT